MHRPDKEREHEPYLNLDYSQGFEQYYDSSAEKKKFDKAAILKHTLMQRMDPKQYLTEKREKPLQIGEKTLEYSMFDHSNQLMNIEEFKGSNF